LHHIVPWSSCHKHEYSNLIALCPTCHRLAHRNRIDRKSLRKIKDSLQAAFQVVEGVSFAGNPIEIRRRIYETEPSNSESFFCFDFPHFPEANKHIVSKNIEAWGFELLQRFRHSQDVERRKQPSMIEWPIEWINCWYEVRRNDATAVSVQYDIEMMAFHAVHRSHETRVQNFMLDPFQPLTVDELLLSSDRMELLAGLVRKRLGQANSALTAYDVEQGTSGGLESFSTFVIDSYGFTFIYDEYRVASYAQGRQYAVLSFEELNGVFKPEYLHRLIMNT
jgi:hypothetical protein